jgi:hypothetical protein
MIAARQIAFGKAAGAKKPYDAEIEYLESTGTQYIDTGIMPTEGSEFVIDLYIPPGTIANRLIIGSVNEGTTSGNYALWLRTYTGGGTYASWGKGNAAGTTTTYPTGDFVKFGLTKGSVSFNNAVAYTFATGDFTPDENMCLLGSGHYYKCLAAKIRGYQHYVAGVLIRDFIPVRKGNIGYMYDRVSGQLFGNQGTGEFVLGPDL